MLEQSSRLEPSGEEIAAKVIEGEAIIINLATGMYFSLDGVGALVWESLTDGHSVEEAIVVVTRRYQVQADQAATDVTRLANQFVTEGLMRRRSDQSGSTVNQSGGAANAPQPYAAPRLNKYADMADLLALDPPMPGLSQSPWAEPAQDA
jgi:hypothetical protein